MPTKIVDFDILGISETWLDTIDKLYLQKSPSRATKTSQWTILPHPRGEVKSIMYVKNLLNPIEIKLQLQT